MQRRIVNMFMPFKIKMDRYSRHMRRIGIQNLAIFLFDRLSLEGLETKGVLRVPSLQNHVDAMEYSLYSWIPKKCPDCRVVFWLGGVAANHREFALPSRVRNEDEGHAFKVQSTYLLAYSMPQTKVSLAAVEYAWLRAIANPIFVLLEGELLGERLPSLDAELLS